MMFLENWVEVNYSSPGMGSFSQGHIIYLVDKDSILYSRTQNQSVIEPSVAAQGCSFSHFGLFRTCKMLPPPLFSVELFILFFYSISLIQHI